MQKMIDAQREVVDTQRARVSEHERELQRLRALKEETETAHDRAQQELLIRVRFLEDCRDQLMRMLDTQAAQARAPEKKSGMARR